MSSCQCLLCQSNQIESYLKSDRVLRCSSCGIVFLAPEQVPAGLGDYYQNNAFYADNASNPVLVKSMIRAAHFYLQTIIKYLKPGSDKLFIDVGSNYGVLVEEASRLGFGAIGLEKNTFLVEAGQKRGLTISTQDLAELSTTQAPLVITVMHVLEHLSDPRAFVEEVYKKLAPAGLLAVAVPNIDSYLAKKDGLSWRYIALEHLTYFSPKVLKRLLSQAGFEILEIRSDDTNLSGLSIKKLLHYLVGPAIARDRFQMKNWQGRSPAVPTISVSWPRRFLKYILIMAIKILQREDFILIIGQKSVRE